MEVSFFAEEGIPIFLNDPLKKGTFRSGLILFTGRLPYQMCTTHNDRYTFQGWLTSEVHQIIPIDHFPK